MANGTAFTVERIERRGQIRFLSIRIGLRRFDVAADINRQVSRRGIARFIGNGIAKDIRLTDSGPAFGQLVAIAAIRVNRQYPISPGDIDASAGHVNRGRSVDGVRYRAGDRDALTAILHIAAGGGIQHVTFNGADAVANRIRHVHVDEACHLGRRQRVDQRYQGAVTFRRRDNHGVVARRQIGEGDRTVIGEPAKQARRDRDAVFRNRHDFAGGRIHHRQIGRQGISCPQQVDDSGQQSARRQQRVAVHRYRHILNGSGTHAKAQIIARQQRDIDGAE